MLGRRLQTTDWFNGRPISESWFLEIEKAILISFFWNELATKKTMEASTRTWSLEFKIGSRWSRHLSTNLQSVHKKGRGYSKPFHSVSLFFLKFEVSFGSGVWVMLKRNSNQQKNGWKVWKFSSFWNRLKNITGVKNRAWKREKFKLSR